MKIDQHAAEVKALSKYAEACRIAALRSRRDFLATTRRELSQPETLAAVFATGTVFGVLRNRKREPARRAEYLPALLNALPVIAGLVGLKKANEPGPTIV